MTDCIREFIADISAKQYNNIWDPAVCCGIRSALRL